MFACSIKKISKTQNKISSLYISRTNKINKVVLIVQNKHSDLHKLHKDMHVRKHHLYKSPLTHQAEFEQEQAYPKIHCALVNKTNTD